MTTYDALQILRGRKRYMSAEDCQKELDEIADMLACSRPVCRANIVCAADGKYYCDRCSAEIVVGSYDDDYIVRHWHFCPNCGAMFGVDAGGGSLHHGPEEGANIAPRDDGKGANRRAISDPFEFCAQCGSLGNDHFIDKNGDDVDLCPGCMFNPYGSVANGKENER